MGMSIQVLDVVSRDLHIIVDISLTDAKGLIVALDHCRVIYDAKKEPDIVNSDSILREFYKTLVEVVKEVDHDSRSDSEEG